MRLALIIVFIFGVLASRTLIFQRGYFNMHDDLQMMRQLSMEKCFLDLQIPCRWIPDMGYGFGFPLFNFYPPLPYLVGEIFRVLGFSFVETAKLLFATAIVASGVAMFYLAKEVFLPAGRQVAIKGGVLAAIFYMWAPYHAVDVYVRGAMNESWALIFFPLIFLFSYKLITVHGSRFTVLLALAWTGLLLSHNLMVMIFAPVFAVWCLLWLWLKKNKDFLHTTYYLLLAGILALGLSAFFTFPAIFENKFTWLKSQLIGYYDYTAHFVDLNQLLISRFWDYGPSVWLEYDRMSFQIGHLHWMLPLFIIVIWLYSLITKKKKFLFINRKSLIIILFLFTVGWFSAFLTHVRSTPVWQGLPFLALVQFPWRFLTLIIFSFSFLIGFLVIVFQKLIPKYYVLCTAIVVSVMIAMNWNYFLPEHGKMGKLTDKEKFSNAAWELQQTAGIYDYLPITAKEAPKAPQKVLAEFMDPKTGEALKDQSGLTKMEQGTNWARFTVKGAQSSVVRIGIFDFPGWKVKVDGELIEHYIPEVERWGRMWINVPEGTHQVVAQFTNTPVRSLSNMISLISWLTLAGIIVFKRKKK